MSAAPRHARKRSTIAEVRDAEYRSARGLGDFRALETGKVGQRARNRLVGRLLTRAFRGMTR